MKLNRLYIKNFKNITEIEIDDFKRINVFVGENGQGKSSCLEAVGFLFTNSLDEKLEEYIRWGQDKFIIEANFTHNGITYQYEVEVGKGTKRRLVVNDSEEFFNSEATKYLADIIDPQLAAYSAISEQGKTTQLLFQKPSERLKTIKQILKYDSIFDAVENIKEDIKLKHSDVEKIDTELNVLTTRSYSMMNEAELKKQVEEDENIEVLLKEQTDQKIQFEINKKEKENYEAELKLYNEKKEKKAKFEESIATFKKQITEQVHEDYKEYDDTELKSLITLKEDQTVEKINYEKDLKSWNEAQVSLASLGQTITVLNKELSEIVIERIAVCKFNEDSVKEIQQKIVDTDINLGKYKEKLELIKQGKCPTCGKDFVEDPKQIEESIVTWQRLREDLVKEKENIIKEIDTYKQALEKQKEKQNAKKNIQDKISFYESESEKHLNVIKPDEFDYNAFENLLKQIKEQEEIKAEIDLKKQQHVEALNKIKSLEDKIVFYENEIKSIGDITEPVKPTIKEISFDENYYESLKKRQAVKQQKIQEYQRAVDFNEKVKKEQSEDKAKLALHEKKKEDLLKEISILSETRNVLEKDFSSYCIDKSIGFIRDKMNQFFQQTYNKYNVTVKQDKNSVTFFYSGVNGVESPCTMSSGAEKSILSIANRIALMSLQDLNMFLLDEVDAELSSDNSVNLFTQLFNQSHIEQFFCITHCEQTKEYFESLNDCNIFEIVNGEIA